MISVDLVRDSRPRTSTRGSDFWLHDGILYGKTRLREPHGDVTDAIDAVDRIQTLTAGRAVPLMFDARHVGWLQIAAREYVHPHASELFTHAAVIVQPARKRVLPTGSLVSLVSKLLGPMSHNLQGLCPIIHVM